MLDNTMANTQINVFDYQRHTNDKTDRVGFGELPPRGALLGTWCPGSRGIGTHQGLVTARCHL